MPMVDQPTGRHQTKILLIDPNREDLDRLALDCQAAGLRVVELSHYDFAAPLYNALRPDAAVVATN